MNKNEFPATMAHGPRYWMNKNKFETACHCVPQPSGEEFVLFVCFFFLLNSYVVSFSVIVGLLSYQLSISFSLQLSFLRANHEKMGCKPSLGWII